MTISLRISYSLNGWLPIGGNQKTLANGLIQSQEILEHNSILKHLSTIAILIGPINFLEIEKPHVKLSLSHFLKYSFGIFAFDALDNYILDIVLGLILTIDSLQVLRLWNFLTCANETPLNFVKCYCSFSSRFHERWIDKNNNAIIQGQFGD